MVIMPEQLVPELGAPNTDQLDGIDGMDGDRADADGDGDAPQKGFKDPQ